MKTVLALAIGAHAIGMIGGVYFVFATKSWLARAFPAGGIALAAVVGVLWVASGVVLLAGAWGYYTSTPWFRPWLIVGAALSLVAIALWAGEIPAGTYVGGVLMVGVLIWQLFFPQSI